MPAQITIGGPLSKEQMLVVFEHIDRIDTALCEPLEPCDVDTLAEDALAKQTPLIYKNELYTRFVDLETWLYNARIPFARVTAWNDRTDGAVVIFDGTRHEEFPTDDDGKVLVPLTALAELIATNRIYEIEALCRLAEFSPQPLAPTPRDRVVILAAIAEYRSTHEERIVTG